MSQAACPRNPASGKPGASAGLACSRPRSALTSENCSCRWKYQPRLTSPSPLTGLFLRVIQPLPPAARVGGSLRPNWDTGVLAYLAGWAIF